MSDIVGRLRNPAWAALPGDARQLHIEKTLADMTEAADEIERLRSLLGAVTPGQSVANIKEHLRNLKKDKPDGSRESAAS